MASTTILFGSLLVALGAGSYVLSDFASVTALIPAFFGVLLIVLGLVARNEQYRKHAMHGAAGVGLLGLLGTAPRALPALLAGRADMAVVAQTIMALLMGIFVALCVKSFIDARRTRSQSG